MPDIEPDGIPGAPYGRDHRHNENHHQARSREINAKQLSQEGATLPSKSAVPSMFITAPSGNTMLLVLCDIPSFSSALFIASGNVARA